jgi:hypothetical protein
MSRIPRITSRIVPAVALTAALLSSAVPAAQARPLAQPQFPSVSGSWIGAALAWLGDLGLGSSHVAQAPRTPVMKTTTPIPVPPPGGPVYGGAHTMCGSVIDPSGHCGSTGG